jgi:SAM-dependent methyltransferase
VDPTGLIVGIDRSTTVLAPARRVSSARLAAGDASALPFAPEVFGVAVAGDLFHHLDADALGTVLREVHRVLRTSGVLLGWWYARPGRPAPDAPRFPRPYEEVRKAAEEVGFSARVLALTESVDAGPPTAGIIATKLEPRPG